MSRGRDNKGYSKNRSETSDNECGLSTCTDHVAEGIQCDRCKKWYHKRCSRLSKKDFGLHMNHPSLKWVCIHCCTLAEECSRLLNTSLINLGTSIARPISTGPSILVNGTSKIDDTKTSNVKPPASQRTKNQLSNGQDTHKKSGKPALGKKKIRRAPDTRTAVQSRPNEPRTKVLDQGGKEQMQMQIAQLESRVNELEGQVKELRRRNELILGKTRGVFIHNLEEPQIKDKKVRFHSERSKVQNVLRLAGVAPFTPLAKIHRVGAWKASTTKVPRPMYLLFKNNVIRDKLIEASKRVFDETNGRVVISMLATHVAKAREESNPSNLKRPTVTLDRMATAPIQSSTPIGSHLEKTRCPSRLDETPRDSTIVRKKVAKPGVPKGVGLPHGITQTSPVATVARPITQTSTEKATLKGNSKSPLSWIGKDSRDVSISENGASWFVPIINQQGGSHLKQKNESGPRVLRPRVSRA